MHDDNDEHVLLARIDERLRHIERMIDDFVTRIEFAPIKALVFGLAGLMLSAVVAAARLDGGQMTGRQWVVVGVLLGPVYAAALLGAYWAWWPLPPTIEVLYSHPYFCDRPCETREEAQRYQVYSVMSGDDEVWHYREIKVNAQRLGAIRASWQSGSFIWNSPQVATLRSPPGIYHRSVAVQPPTSNPTRDFAYQLSFHYELTPMREESIEFPPVRLRVIAHGK